MATDESEEDENGTCHETINKFVDEVWCVDTDGLDLEMTPLASNMNTYKKFAISNVEEPPYEEPYDVLLRNEHDVFLNQEINSDCSTATYKLSSLADQATGCGLLDNVGEGEKEQLEALTKPIGPPQYVNVSEIMVQKEEKENTIDVHNNASNDSDGKAGGIQIKIPPWSTQGRRVEQNAGIRRICKERKCCTAVSISIM